MKAMRCLLVDDERLARNNLKALLAAHPDLVVAGEAADARQALEAVRQLKPDLIFLDIHLSGEDGFQLLEQLENPPKIIFVTAYDRYAVRAFEVNAVDYLLKPVDPLRLKQAVERLRPGAQAEKRLPARQPLQIEDSLLVPVGRSGYFIRVEDILTIKAERNYSVLLTRDGRSHTILSPLADWEQRLPPSAFFRTGRNLIINLRQIRKVEPSGRHVYVEIGANGLRVELGRAAADRLKQILGVRHAVGSS